MTKGYIQLSKAWYGEANFRPRTDNLIEEISAGIVLNGQMVWIHFEYHGGPNGLGIGSPRLGCYNDSWEALAACPELIAEMGKVSKGNLPPDRLCEMLERAGFADVTPLTPSNAA